MRPIIQLEDLSGKLGQRIIIAKKDRMMSYATSDVTAEVAKIRETCADLSKQSGDIGEIAGGILAVAEELLALNEAAELTLKKLRTGS